MKLQQPKRRMDSNYNHHHQQQHQYNDKTSNQGWRRGDGNNTGLSAGTSTGSSNKIMDSNSSNKHLQTNVIRNNNHKSNSITNTPSNDNNSYEYHKRQLKRNYSDIDHATGHGTRSSMNSNHIGLNMQQNANVNHNDNLTGRSYHNQQQWDKDVNANMQRGSIPPPPPPPTPPTATSSYPNRYNKNTSHRSKNGISSTILLEGIPPYIKWQDLSHFISKEFNVNVRFVKIVPPSTVSSSCCNGINNKNNGYCKGFVRLSTHEEAIYILNQWQQQEQHQGEVVAGNNYRNDNSNPNKRIKRQWYILNQESINIIGLHDDSIPAGVAGPEGTAGGTGGGRKGYSKIVKSPEKNNNHHHQSEWNLKDDEDPSIQLQLQIQHQHQQQQEQEQYQQQIQQQQEEWIQQRKQNQIKRQKLQIQKDALSTKKELISKQEVSLSKQITLHKKMVSIMNDPKDKTKKMKDILELQKKVNGLKKELLGVMEEMEGIKDKEKELVLKKKGFYSSNGGKQYSLDKRTTVVKVEGIQIQQLNYTMLKKGTGDNNDDDDNTDSNKYGENLNILDEIKKHFESFGAITDVTWLQDEGESHDDQNQQKSLLVNCSNRVVAERLMNDEASTKFNAMTLTLSWYHKPSNIANNGDLDSNKDDGTIREEEHHEENHMMWTEDAELGIDYDYDEDDE